MHLLNLAFKQETATPMLALVFASAASVLLVLARILWTDNIRYVFLVWNLFLAWLPLVFALLAHDDYQQAPGGKWRFRAFAGAWLLFFPNAPYIFTDLIHLTSHFHAHFWVDMVLILTFAVTGMVLGFVSLYLMQGVVNRMFGSLASWIFIAAVAGLSGFGIYLGRFLRFNSWDVFFRPISLYRGIGHWVSDPLAHPNSVAFPVLFGTFLFLSYLMLYGLTHLHPLQPARSGQMPARVGQA